MASSGLPHHRLSGFEDRPKVANEMQQAAVWIALAIALQLADEGCVCPCADDEGGFGGGCVARGQMSLLASVPLAARAHQLRSW
jgi:hypothetical protein